MYILVSALKKKRQAFAAARAREGPHSSHDFLCGLWGGASSSSVFFQMFRKGSRFPCPFFWWKLGFGGVHHLGLRRKKCLKRKTDNELVQVCHVFFFLNEFSGICVVGNDWPPNGWMLRRHIPSSWLLSGKEVRHILNVCKKSPVKMWVSTFMLEVLPEDCWYVTCGIAYLLVVGPAIPLQWRKPGWRWNNAESKKNPLMGKQSKGSFPDDLVHPLLGGSPLSK